MKLNPTPKVILFASFILLSIIYIGAFRINHLSDRIENKDNFIRSLQDSIRVKDGKARISRLETNNFKEIINFKTNDSVMLQLQKSLRDMEKEITKVGSAVTAIKSETIILSKNPTVVLGDSINPIYKSHKKDKWYEITTVASKDSTEVSLLTRNSYNVTLGYERKGWFSTTPFAEVENLNPNTETTGLRSISLKGRSAPKVSLGTHFGVGAQYGIINKKVDIGPQAGVSINVKF